HFTTSGTPWANRTITFSFMPDGTKNPHDNASALFANLNGVASQEVWQKEVARALAAWTKHANLDFRMVSDDGSKAGSSGPAQGDPRFGDIRISAASIGSYSGLTYYPQLTGTHGGDLYLNSDKFYKIGEHLDLF